MLECRVFDSRAPSLFTGRGFMSFRRLLVRALAVMVAVTLGWSLTASCIEGAASTPGQQMACCKRGHHSCPMRGTPEDCCKSESHVNQLTQCTAVDKFNAKAPQLVALHLFQPLVASAVVIWPPTPVAYDSSPPIPSTPPTYLVLSSLRI
jgi:hypothetical protein